MAKIKAKMYNPHQIEELMKTPEGIREARRTYSELRKIANKRIARLEAAGFRSYRQDNQPFAKLENIWTVDLAYELSELTRYLMHEGTTVREAKTQRKRFLEGMHDKGYYYITEANYYDFLDFMGNMREVYGARAFDSGDAVDVYNETQRLNIPREVVQKHYEYFVQKQDQLETLQPKKSRKSYKFNEVKKKITKQEEITRS